jgi:hypothetical protein
VTWADEVFGKCRVRLAQSAHDERGDQLVRRCLLGVHEPTTMIV